MFTPKAWIASNMSYIVIELTYKEREYMETVITALETFLYMDRKLEVATSVSDGTKKTSWTAVYTLLPTRGIEGLPRPRRCIPSMDDVRMIDNFLALYSHMFMSKRVCIE